MPARRFSRKRRSYRKRRSGYGRKRKTYRRKSFRSRRVRGRTRKAFLHTRQYSSAVNLTVSTGAFMNQRDPINVSLLNRWGELSPLFQFFKITKVQLQVFHNGYEHGSGNISDISLASGGLSGTVTNRPVGRIYVTTYPWNGWSTTAPTVDNIREIEGTKRRCLKRGWNTFNLNPIKWMGEYTQTTSLTAEIDRPNGWIPFTNPAVQHWCKGVVFESTDQFYNHNLVVRYRCEVICKGLH